MISYGQLCDCRFLSRLARKRRSRQRWTTPITVKPCNGVGFPPRSLVLQFSPSCIGQEIILSHAPDLPWYQRPGVPTVCPACHIASTGFHFFVFDVDRFGILFPFPLRLRYDSPAERKPTYTYLVYQPILTFTISPVYCFIKTVFLSIVMSKRYGSWFGVCN